MDTPLILSIFGVLLSAGGFAVTIYTIVKSNAKNQQALESRFDVVDLKIEHVQQEQKQLSDRVDKHNKVVERTYELEGIVRENSHDIVELKSDTREIKNKLMNMTRRQ